MNVWTHEQALKLGAIAILISTVLPVLVQLMVVVTPAAANIA